MPITASAKKALRQSKRRNARNQKRREAFRSVIRDIEKLVASKKANEAEKLLPKAYQALDKAAKTGVMKKNAAARKKSRLTKLIRKSPR